MITIIMNLIILAFIRNQFTYWSGIKTDNLISKYCQDLINKKQYDISFDYYKYLEISYFRHFLSLWKWGKYSWLKKEYKKLLKPYMN